MSDTCDRIKKKCAAQEGFIHSELSLPYYNSVDVMSVLHLFKRRSVGAAKALLLPPTPRYISSRNTSCVSNGGIVVADTNNKKQSACSSHARKESISTFLDAFRPERVLVTGALGQVGQELVPALQSAYGIDNVIPTDVRDPPGVHLAEEHDNFRRLDVLDPTQLQELCKEEEINTIVHLAAILSANGEKNPLLALKINNG